MSVKSEQFKAHKAAREEAIKAMHANNKRIAESMHEGVRVTSNLPDTAESKESAILIAGMTDTVLAMLPPWTRIEAVPPDMLKRARDENGAYRRDGAGAIILVADVKLWRRHQNAALRSVRNGDARIIRVNGREVFDLAFPIYPNRMLRLIADGNMELVLEGAPELLRAITNKGKSTSSDESAMRALDDGFLDGAASNLIDPHYAKIVLSAARLTTARVKLEKAEETCALTMGSVKYTESLAARDKIAESIPNLESAFKAAWSARHTIKVDTAPSASIVSALADGTNDSDLIALAQAAYQVAIESGKSQKESKRIARLAIHVFLTSKGIDDQRATINRVMKNLVEIAIVKAEEVNA